MHFLQYNNTTCHSQIYLARSQLFATHPNPVYFTWIATKELKFQLQAAGAKCEKAQQVPYKPTGAMNGHAKLSTDCDCPVQLLTTSAVTAMSPTFTTAWYNEFINHSLQDYLIATCSTGRYIISFWVKLYYDRKLRMNTIQAMFVSFTTQIWCSLCKI